MGFFDRSSDVEWPDFDDSDDIDRAVYLGGVVPLETLIARSETGAVGVRSVVAYPDGFEFTVVAWRRRRPPQGDARRSFFSPFDFYRGGDVPDEFVRFGLEFPDGCSVTNLGERRGVTGDATGSAHGLDARGGSGTDLEEEQQFWAWPVPTTGTLAMVCEWPAHGIAETRIEINAAEIYEASQRATLVWPTTPDRS